MEDDSDGEDTPGSTPRAADAEKAGGGGDDDDDDEDSDSEGDISSDDESSGSDVDEVRPHKKELFLCLQCHIIIIRYPNVHTTRSFAETGLGHAQGEGTLCT
jgi:hypothetical protein